MRGAALTTRFALVAAAASVAWLYAPRAMAETPAAAAPAAVDTSKWVCKFCPFEEPGFTITPTFGVGYVTDDSAKFGEYNGLDERGVYVAAGADGRYRGKDGLWLDLAATDLGLDSRSLALDGGRQGHFGLHFRFKELSHAISDTASTPFAGAGSSTLTLPSAWVAASTTGGMSLLDASRRDLDLSTRRQLFDLGGNFTRFRHWTFDLDFRHEEKTGTRATGGSFIFNDSRLPLPIDYKTDQIDASAAFDTGRFQARLAYYGSLFANDDAALVFANPYLPLAPGGDTGQIALPPDNQFHQLALTSAFRIAERAQVSGAVALGRMTQNDAFLPYTINSSIPVQALPRTSLDGQVDTLSANLRLTATPIGKLRLNASVVYDERNNQTASASYDIVTTDTAVGAPRFNRPYSYSHTVGSVDAAYPLARWLRLYAGCSIDEFGRDLQEVRTTNESRCWGKATVRAQGIADVALKYTHAERTGSDYTLNPDGTPAQNPLMRLYTMADRDRDEVKLRVDLMAGQRFNVGVDGNVTWDSYYNTLIGLLDGRSWSAALDCSWMITEKMSASCFASHEQVTSRQANAEALAPSPLWVGEGTNTVDSAGAGFRYAFLGKFDLGLDYTFVRSTGELAIKSATVGFPDRQTRLNSARLYLDFAARKKLSLRLSYWYEDYRYDDWALDGVAPATIGNVLAFGEGTPSYFVNVFALTGRYQF